LTSTLARILLVRIFSVINLKNFSLTSVDKCLSSHVEQVKSRVLAEIEDIDIPSALRQLHGRKMEDDISDVFFKHVPDRFSRIQAAYYEGGSVRHDDHDVAYHPGRVLADSTEVVDESTTNPFNIVVNFDNLYEATGVKYRSCYKAGEFFKWGNPASTTPGSGTPCDRTKLGFGQVNRFHPILCFLLPFSHLLLMRSITFCSK
jgi:hypothetical protein